MNYKGAYSGTPKYNIGDVVVFENVPFYLFNEAAAGTKPHDTHCWARLPQPLADVVIMFHSMLTTVNSSISTAQTTANNVSKMIAPEYTKTTYAEGAHVTHSGKLYVAKADIETAENWTAAHWDEVTVGAEILALQTDVAALGE